jgi:hypothetical protein
MNTIDIYSIAKLNLCSQISKKLRASTIIFVFLCLQVSLIFILIPFLTNLFILQFLKQ